MLLTIPANLVVGELVAFDEDKNDTHVFILIGSGDESSRDNSKFYIENNKLKNSEELNFQDDADYKIMIQAEDSKGAKNECAFQFKFSKQKDCHHATSH